MLCSLDGRTAIETALCELIDDRESPKFFSFVE